MNKAVVETTAISIFESRESRHGGHRNQQEREDTGEAIAGKPKYLGLGAQRDGQRQCLVSVPGSLTSNLLQALAQIAKPNLPNFRQDKKKRYVCSSLRAESLFVSYFEYAYRYQSYHSDA